jgi:DNA helicase IV
MTAKATEIAAEQQYFDTAEAHWRRWLAEVKTLAEAGADKQAARALKKLSKDQAAKFADSQAVAVGRIDPDDGGESLYIGRHLIKDDRGEILVVNWQADAAIAYHLASLTEPHGLTRRRTFRCDGNTILDFADVIFAETGADIDAALLAELGRRRDGALRDIVATIQAAQFELIRASMEQLLVIEGGPGTGKTEIALHRVSWLLYHNADRLRADDFLVIGPNPTFMRYIGQVLPALGDADVPMRDIGQLAPDVTRGRGEPPAVAKLKGDVRMAEILARGLEMRIGVPEAAERLLVGSRYINLPGSDVADVIGSCRSASGTYAERRRLFRERLTALVAERVGGDPGRQPAVESLIERLWPQLTAAAFLRDLYNSRSRLSTATAGQLTAEELALLHRRGADRLSREIWSAADLPLLDEAEALINGTPARYAHVVVDEVQDLSPMQLRSIARRSKDGSMTIVGDLAQATGPWAADSWTEITRHLPDKQPVSVRPLRYGYRVPEQILAFARRLLPRAAPATTPPEAVLSGPAEPTIQRVGLAERANRVAATAQLHSKAGRFVGVICPAQCRREVEEALTALGVGWGGEDVTLLSPADAKGLEFDVVVVVEPEAIVAEGERGHRMLYIAFTRATTELDVICVGESMPVDASPGRADTGERSDNTIGYQVPRLAEYIADRIRHTLPEQNWDQVLAMVRKRLER